ncbi:c-type cytochrome biogenesis protein CcmI [Maritimibacter sp. HL-12]|uniref:c-type cytochrome biogenesis protein CcmI n=1 Tax=Maritimibacter sp. HL-12 TaxID=1162418 RepID=UPI000A0F384C|nr:c-type cytochrome biogenesis protein CcmI [Maritimibacter sp. HL-12]SMH30731.1 cytochrome c-type biogenesis protein CcmH [Maritimibacter sp. HL-12]
MIGFWILAGLFAVVAIAILGRALLTKSGEVAATADFDMQVYRDQLRELDRDVARGVIGKEEAERARTEISRRLLDADRKARAGKVAGNAPRAATVTAFALSGIVVLGGGFWLYTDMGAPGYWDMPLKARFEAAEIARESRASQAELEAALPAWSGPPAAAPADYVELVEKLREAASERPDELQGQLLLAQHEAALGNYVAARKAMARVIELRGEMAAADEYSQYADLLALAAGGEISPEAEDAVEAALALNPRDHVARYYAGLLQAQIGRPDLAFPIWRDLLEGSDPSEPWVAPIMAQIRQLAALAGEEYTPPELESRVPGLSADDVAAAENLTPEERAQMLDELVRSLMQRLASEGGSAADWARLIEGLGVLGDLDRAAAIFAEAQNVFANRPDDLALIEAAAGRAGLGGSAPAEDNAPALAGPTAEDMDSAAEMEAEDRAAMIEGMVARLFDTLTEDGGTPDRWAQLFNALAVQGDAERAQIAWEAAQADFADDAATLDALRPAAQAAGATE